MSDSVMYPEAGRWVNSYLVGANAYKNYVDPRGGTAAAAGR